MRIETRLPPSIDVPLQYKQTLYRVLREAMTNAMHHSGGTHAQLELGIEDDDVVASVTDDGHGFDGAAPRRGDGHGDDDDDHSGLGLRLMAEQVRALDGTFEIVSGASGTCVSIRLPRPGGETDDRGSNARRPPAYPGSGT